MMDVLTAVAGESIWGERTPDFAEFSDTSRVAAEVTRDTLEREAEL